MKCPACGADIPDAAERFCIHCGRRLPEDPGPPHPAPSIRAEDIPTAPLPRVAPASQVQAAADERPAPGEPAPPEEQVTTTCPACGSANRPGASFCLQCGRPLSAAPAPPQESTPPPSESPPSPTPAAGPEPPSDAEPEPAPVLALPAESAAPEPAPQVVLCPQCGAENRPVARFCLACGQALSPVPESEEPPPMPAAGPGEAPPLAQAAPGPLERQVEAAAPVSPPAEPVTPPVEPAPVERETAQVAGPGAQAPLTPTPPPLAETAAPAPSSAEPVTLPAEPSPIERETDQVAGPEAQAPLTPPPPPLAETAAPAPPPAEPVTPPAEPSPTEGETDQVAGPEAQAPLTPPPPPLAAKTLIAGRYRVLEILPAPDEGANLYAVADLQHCWNCERAVEDPTQPFCVECGADVTEPPPQYRLYLTETPAPGGEEDLPEDAFVEKGRLYTLTPRKAEPAQPLFPQGVRLTAGRASDAGQVRDLDEDSVLALTLTGLYEGQAGLTVGLYIVADGIGGHEGGEVASRLAIQIIAGELLSGIIYRLLTGDVDLPLLDEAAFDHVRRAVATANERIFRLRTNRDNDMGTTVTLALVLNDMAYIANVGDSRTYLWGQNGLEQVTTDHSVIARLIASGVAEPEEIYTHPQRSVIYRSLGDKPNIEVDLFSRKLVPGNVLLLCCDGLWEMVRNEGLEELLLQALPPQAACDEAVRRANQAGGEDNISVVMVQVE